MSIGCKLGIISSNIIAYADDIVLLAPSAAALSFIIAEAYLEAINLNLSFNYSKTKVMRFDSRVKSAHRYLKNQFCIDNNQIEMVSSIKYLGYIISDDMSCKDDILRVKRKFYAEYNSILRKFHSADNDVKIYLFKQYCNQFYGVELWFGCKNSIQIHKDFAIGYHKSVKKLLNLSFQESNHFACQEAGLLMFNHLINKMKISAAFRIFKKPCCFMEKVRPFLHATSTLLKEILKIIDRNYQMDSLFDNDIHAIMARISFVQNHEEQMRLSW